MRVTPQARHSRTSLSGMGPPGIVQTGCIGRQQAGQRSERGFSGCVVTIGMKLPPARPFGLELNQTAHACGKEKEKSPGGRNLPSAWRSAGGIAGRNVGIELVGTVPARVRRSVARLLRHGEKVIARRASSTTTPVAPMTSCILLEVIIRAPAQCLLSRGSLPEPLELGLGVGELDEILRAGVGGGLEGRDGGGAVGAQEVPFADVELRLAALVGLGGSSQRRLERAAAEIELDHRIGPFAHAELPRIGSELGGGALIAAARAREIQP